MELTITVGGTSIPTGNLTALKLGNEIIWSSNTGRSASSGKMLGDIVARKRTISLVFSWIKNQDLTAITQALDANAFSTVVITLGTTSLVNIVCYRSTIEREYGGNHGGINYWSSVSFDLIQQ